jgi:hypothetical protein
VIVRFVDIGGIDDFHCLNFQKKFIMCIEIKCMGYLLLIIESEGYSLFTVVFCTPVYKMVCIQGYIYLSFSEYLFCNNSVKHTFILYRICNFVSHFMSTILTIFSINMI